jgi:erythromycin esterase
LSQGHDASAEERRAADALIVHLRQTSARAVIWDGLGRLSGTGTIVGTRLRDELGDGYCCIVTTFTGGSLRDFALPAPIPSSLDASLAAATHDSDGPVIIDIRKVQAPLVEWLDENHRLRIISGMYDPEGDEDHYLEVADLRRAIDALILLPTISPAS